MKPITNFTQACLQVVVCLENQPCRLFPPTPADRGRLTAADSSRCFCGGLGAVVGTP